ncbi:MAG: ArsR/SmtB family transcription factor [Acidimicrobiia bacterium]
MDVLQVIAEPRRREILALVWDTEMAAGDIAARSAVTFGAVSQHLSVLRGAGLVAMRKDGNHRYYRADKESLGSLRVVLEEMWSKTLDHLSETIEGDMSTGEPK